MKDSGKMINKMVMEIIHFQKDALTVENGVKVKYMV